MNYKYRTFEIGVCTRSSPQASSTSLGPTTNYNREDGFQEALKKELKDGERIVSISQPRLSQTASSDWLYWQGVIETPVD